MCYLCGRPPEEQSHDAYPIGVVCDPCALHVGAGFACEDNLGSFEDLSWVPVVRKEGGSWRELLGFLGDGVQAQVGRSAGIDEPEMAQ